MDLHPDFRDLLAELVHEGVRFVVVGGYAVGRHAKPRATKDLDVLVSGQGDNLERVARALERFGAPATVIEAARSLKADEIVYLGREPVRVDILRSADGIDTEDVIARAVLAKFDDLELPIIALADLIANKKASARRQDLADVELLERVRARSSTT
jgi:predicted nucleotidyltransferase